VAGRKAKFYKLACAPFHVFGGRAVIKDYQRVGTFEIHTYHFQPKFNPVLLADDHEQPRISFSEAEKRLVMRGLAQHIEFATKRAVELVHEELLFA